MGKYLNTKYTEDTEGTIKNGHSIETDNLGDEDKQSKNRTQYV